MTDKTVLKFDHESQQLMPWDPTPPEILLSGEGIQRGFEYLNLDNGTIQSGIWDCTPCQLVSAPYEVNELMLVLKGSIHIEHDSGDTESFHAGEWFVLPKGTPCSWIQTEYALKYYFIFDDPSGQKSDNQVDLRAFRLDLSADLPRVENHDPGAYLSDVPDMGHLSLFKDVTGQMEVGIWDCTPMKRKPATLARSELMHILEGRGSITNADGVVFEFTAGDTFLVPIGMGYQWHNTEYVKKIFCSFTPSSN